jgi:hypothetical protein
MDEEAQKRKDRLAAIRKRKQAADANRNQEDAEK